MTPQTRDATSYFVARTSGLSLRYDIGSGHPLIGRSAPDLELDDGRRVGHYLRAGNALLLDFTSSKALEGLGKGWSDRLAYVSNRPSERRQLGAVLVRPDGFVAAAAAADSDVDAAEFEAAIKRWLGARRG